MTQVEPTIHAHANKVPPATFSFPQRNHPKSQEATRVLTSSFPVQRDSIPIPDYNYQRILSRKAGRILNLQHSYTNYDKYNGSPAFRSSAFVAEAYSTCTDSPMYVFSFRLPSAVLCMLTYGFSTVAWFVGYVTKNSHIFPYISIKAVEVWWIRCMLCLNSYVWSSGIVLCASLLCILYFRLSYLEGYVY